MPPRLQQPPHPAVRPRTAGGHTGKFMEHCDTAQCTPTEIGIIQMTTETPPNTGPLADLRVIEMGTTHKHPAGKSFDF